MCVPPGASLGSPLDIRARRYYGSSEMKNNSGPSQVTSIRMTKSERDAVERLRKRLGLASRSEAMVEAIYIALESTR